MAVVAIAPPKLCADCWIPMLTAAALPGSGVIVCVPCYTRLTGGAPMQNQILKYDGPLHAGSYSFVGNPVNVCKTPSPGGPVPMPYPNVATWSGPAPQKVKSDGAAATIAGRNFKTSTGHEAGTAGSGIASNTVKGKAEFVSFSSDVRFEGKAVARLTDLLNRNA